MNVHCQLEKKDVDRRRIWKRICQNMNNVEDIIAAREVENWRGLALADTQSKGKYLQKSSIQNDFLLESIIIYVRYQL